MLNTRRRTVHYVILAGFLLVGGCGDAQSPGSDDASSSGVVAGSSGVSGTVVHLFEWPWADVAAECELFLGPAGYDAVQVSPPSENHIVSGRPWWERYQVVSYQLETRAGSRADFADMVGRCHAVGVDIMVDAVINHTTDADLAHSTRTFTGRGTAGSAFTSYDYPGLYSYDDFHHCGLTPDDDIRDNGDRAQVETCELVDLADLATGTPKVRSTLAGYLRDLASLGVAELRIDAALHMAQADVAAILEEAEWDGYVVQEVSQSDSAPRYRASGAVTDFDFGRAISSGVREGSLSDMVRESFWENPNHESELALSFVDNHDTQRHGPGIMTHKDEAYGLAAALMLAVPYGRARVMSSYAFEDSNAGPPSNDSDEMMGVHSSAADCGMEWVCEHRWPVIAGMVGFRAAVDGQPVKRLQEAGADRVAFTRGDRGWVAFNRSSEPWEVVHQTGLPGTSYCNAAGGPQVGGTCPGGSVRVDAGMVSATVPPMGVVAIHVASN